MKKLIITILFCSSACIISQNITNTLGSNGIFTIKDASTTYLTLNQSNGLVGIAKNLTLTETPGTQTGILFKGTDRFLHTYHPAGTDGYNTFLGINSGNFTMSGSYYSASYNTAVGSGSLSSLTTGFNNDAFGYRSLYSNTTGYYNSSFGYQSLFFNTSGSSNAAFGSFSLYSNTTGYANSSFGYQSLIYNTTGYLNSSFGNNSLSSNTTGYENSAFGNNSLNSNTSGIRNSAFGNSSLYSNTTGYFNSSFGYHSLRYNTTGYRNSSFGHESLRNNTTGRENSAFGSNSLYSNTTGYENSAFGNNSLNSNTTGSNNTSIGYFAGGSILAGSNNTAIGYDAQVPSGNASNQVRIGNTSVTYAGVQVAWTITSDRRWKENIKPVNLGLSFISKLNPVSYTRINDESQKNEFGFIAQEVEQALEQENAGMITIDDKGNYELRYNDLLAPMVKAIQELKSENDVLKKKLAEFEIMQNELANEIETLKNVKTKLTEK